MMIVLFSFSPFTAVFYFQSCLNQMSRIQLQSQQVMSVLTESCRRDIAHIPAFKLYLAPVFHVLFQTHVLDLIGCPLTILSSHFKPGFDSSSQPRIEICFQIFDCFLTKRLPQQHSCTLCDLQSRPDITPVVGTCSQSSS